MNDQVLKSQLENITLAPSGREIEQNEVDKLLGSSGRILTTIRKQMLDAESAFARDMATLQARVEDEVAQLKASHVKRMATLMAAKRKVEAMRDA